MKFKIKILETEQQIQQMVLNELLPYCEGFLQKAFRTIRQELPAILAKYITNRPEYMSLVSGSLRLELGIPDADAKIMELISHWVNNVHVYFSGPKIIGNKIKASFSISLVEANFADVLHSDAAYIQDTVRGYNLPWLEWLLFDGTKVLVPRQQVMISPNPRSRTGMAIMRQAATGWRIPSEFAGTIRDNWITRSIEDASSDINELLERSLS